MTINPEYSISLSEILVALLTFLAAGLGYIIKEQRDKIKIIRGQLSDKKYKVYHDIYTVFFDLMKPDKGNHKNVETTKLASRLIDIKKDLLIYAPDVVVNKFLEWNRYINNEGNHLSHAQLFFDLCILIRKDMGHSKTVLTPDDVLRSIMSSDEDFLKMKAMMVKQPSS